MSKTELIDGIVAINQSAERTFLDRFDEIALDEYLKHLLAAQTASPSGESHGPARHPDAARADGDNLQAEQAEASSQTAVAVLEPPAESFDTAGRDDSSEHAADDSRDVEDAPAGEPESSRAGNCPEQPAAENQTHVFALVDFAAEGENWQLPLFAARETEQPAAERPAVNPPADLIAGDLPAIGLDAAAADAEINDAHGMFCLDIADCDSGESIIDEFLRSPVSPEIAAILNEIKVDIGQSDPLRPAAVEIQKTRNEPAEPQAVEEIVQTEEPRTFGAITLPAIVSPSVEIPLARAGLTIDDILPVEEHVAVPDEIPAAQEPLYHGETGPSVVEAAEEVIDEAPADESQEQADRAGADEDSQTQASAEADGDYAAGPDSDYAVEPEMDEADLPEAIEVEDSDAGMAVAASDEPDICML
ncbi:MAG: hypothetical protein HZA50_15370 [Planctomycetes bacterium]|nr:hypothetical protein [Planctomycetota bacterium]